MVGGIGMRWLVISDNHGDRAILTTMKQALHPDVTFHCGDSEMSPSDPWFHGVYAVKGNMDFDPDFPVTCTPVVADTQVLLTHGDHDGVNFDLTQLQLHAQKVGAQAVFFGHTHLLGAEMVAGRLYVNPGSISQPRGQYRDLGGTCALITVEPDQWDVQYYTRDAQPVKDLHVTFARPKS